MKLTIAVAMLTTVAFAFVGPVGEAQTPTKADQCAAYARQAAGSAPTSTGAARGAARGAIIGGAASGNAGGGAAAGAVVGGARKAAQKNRSYQSYSNECMSR